MLKGHPQDKLKGHTRDLAQRKARDKYLLWLEMLPFTLISN